jgi:hypothetical protein
MCIVTNVGNYTFLFPDYLLQTIGQLSYAGNLIIIKWQEMITDLPILADN